MERIVCMRMLDGRDVDGVDKRGHGWMAAQDSPGTGLTHFRSEVTVSTMPPPNSASAQLRGRETGDVVSRKTRSRIMTAVAQSNTSVERAVRQILTTIGARYRLNVRALPGSPDIANQSKGWAVFVNGCFWHGHRNCPRLKSDRNERVPVANRGYWEEKLRANRSRDARKVRELRRLGLRVMLVWECELNDPASLLGRLAKFVRIAADGLQ